MKSIINKPTVFVGLSGGVDSAVAAARLLEKGYTVVGVFIKVWHPEWLVCNWQAERLDAMRVAAKLNIPFLTCDAEAAYRDDVAQYFIREYQAGRTPNPDVMCNQYVKFGRFLDFAQARGADYIATGHYARRVDIDAAALYRGVDEGKDQTYFLWTLTPSQLAFSLFPVGDTPKSAIRAEALVRGLPVAQKRDSQGICFLGQVDIKDFLARYIDIEPGVVLDREGRQVGRHAGALVYTLGQRHGFTVDSESAKTAPHYVVARDMAANTITVDVQKPQQSLGSDLRLTDVVLRSELTTGDCVSYQTRYRQAPLSGTVQAVDGHTLTLLPDTPGDLPAAGQSVVLYSGDCCLGGGIVS